MKRQLIYIVSMTALWLTLAVSAGAVDIAVIVNNENTNSVNQTTIKKIYHGKMKSWPAGGSVRALDLPDASPVREAFSSSILGKSVSNMKAKWAQMIFSGKGTPPKVVNSDEEVKKIVATNKNAIGYIAASSLDGSVKAVLK